MISLVILTFFNYHIRTVTSSSEKFTHPLIQSFSSHSLHISFTYLSHLHHFATRSLLLRGHVSEQSMTILTPCPSSEWLCRHYVRAVNDYADTMVNDNAHTMSEKSITMRTPCLRSQWLCGHRVWAVNDYADTMSEQSMTLRRGHHVWALNNYAEIQSKQSLTLRTPCLLFKQSITMRTPCLSNQWLCGHHV